MAGMPGGCIYHRERLALNAWVVPPFEVAALGGTPFPAMRQHQSGVDVVPIYESLLNSWQLQPDVSSSLEEILETSVTRYLEGLNDGLEDDKYN